MKDGEIVQMGTPQQIVAYPASDYVREFVKDVPRAKVLTARTIMQAVNSSSTTYENHVQSDTTLEQLIPITAELDSPIAVTEDGAVIGTVDRTAVMMALADQSAEGSKQ